MRDLFQPGASSPEMIAAVSDRAWLDAMVRFEVGLAVAQARLGIIPAAAAAAISAGCSAAVLDPVAIGREAPASGTPVVPLLRALTRSLPAEAAAHLHWGATSQDAVDTAMMLVARRGLEVVVAALDHAAASAARLVRSHRATPMAARTLMQQALPTTFGLKAAGWLVALIDARARVVAVRDQDLAIQLGGAAGTLAALGDRGLEVAAELAGELGLAEPVLPWHTSRGRVAGVAMALSVAAAAAGKIALDVILLSQTEVAEVAEAANAGPGGSSTLPQKRNPVGSVAVLAQVRAVNAQVGLLLAAMVQEHERAAGAWQSEWGAVTEAFLMAGGALSGIGGVLDGLTVDETAMRRNLELTGGAIVSERLLLAITGRISRSQAADALAAISARAAMAGTSFRQAALADAALGALLGPDAIAAALEPETYLGSAPALVDRALSAYERALEVPT